LGNWKELDEDQGGDGFELEQTRYHNQANEIDGNSGDPITETQGNAVWADPAYDAAGNMTEGPAPERR